MRNCGVKQQRQAGRRRILACVHKRSTARLRSTQLATDEVHAPPGQTDSVGITVGACWLEVLAQKISLRRVRCGGHTVVGDRCPVAAHPELEDAAHTVALVIVDASDQLSHQRLHQLLAAKLPQLARFRSRLVTKPLGIGQPVWAEIDDYDPSPQIHCVTVRAPGGRTRARRSHRRLEYRATGKP